ncbi:DUF185-domain-containing protein [Auriculariales sp. MPI-PUGE-AT-0066]|nr:DUF185-domain-containing protein [Auriculariales sp. MPI-PUGE-AT-0066]
MLSRVGRPFHHAPRSARRAFSTVLEREIARTITATGPISFARYMELCLQHPTEGYYARSDSQSDIIGARGDFVTSPEISQHFGQLIAIWFLSLWQDLDPLPRIRIVELGPGRGTLTADVLHAIQSIPRAKDAVSGVDLVESSASLKQAQQQILSEQQNVRWWKTLEDVPQTDDFVMVIAHEFFDALPFHIIQRTGDGWQEVMVDNSPPQEDVNRLLVNGEPKSRSVFRHVLSGPSLLASKLATVSTRFSNPAIPMGTRIEISPRAHELARGISKFMSDSKQGGAALIVDYGDDRFFSNSARAFQDHKLVDIFHQPGRTDLTANVDFALLKEAACANGLTASNSAGGVDLASTVSVYGPINQATFLTRMGLQMRLAQSLKQARDEAAKTRILKAAGRLIETGPKGMGGQYKFMGFSTKPAGSEVYPFVEDM